MVGKFCQKQLLTAGMSNHLILSCDRGVLRRKRESIAMLLREEPSLAKSQLDLQISVMPLDANVESETKENSSRAYVTYLSQCEFDKARRSLIHKPYLYRSPSPFKTFEQTFSGPEDNYKSILRFTEEYDSIKELIIHHDSSQLDSHILM